MPIASQHSSLATPAAVPFTPEHPASAPGSDPVGEFAMSAIPPSHTPPCYEVPEFPPVLAGRSRSRLRLRRVVRRRRRGLAACLATAAAAMAVSAAHGAPRPPTIPPPRSNPPAPVHRQAREVVVRAPIRIADTAVARLLHPGDRVDVLAADRVVAAAAKVVAVPPEAPEPMSTVPAHDGGAPTGALIILSVTRRTAAALSGAAASSPLGVALC